MTLITQLRERRHREAGILARYDTTYKWWSKNSNLVKLAPKPTLLTLRLWGPPSCVCKLTWERHTAGGHNETSTIGTQITSEHLLCTQHAVGWMEIQRHVRTMLHSQELAKGSCVIQSSAPSLLHPATSDWLNSGHPWSTSPGLEPPWDLWQLQLHSLPRPAEDSIPYGCCLWEQPPAHLHPH